MSVQVVIDFYDAVALPFVTYPSERAAHTIPCPISGNGLLKTTLILSDVSTYVVHMLTHRADITVLLLVVVEVFGCKRILLHSDALLLLLEGIVLNIGSNVIILEVLIVLLRTIATVGCYTLRQLIIQLFKAVQMSRQGQRIGGIREEVIIGDDLVISSDLHI